ncbi:hypothetical protein K0M31_017945 [Melipona bicolor]|uniref:Uncharacterized protein n=1 Tax=Melipona bicolor TaxID=60889 RepID=A0AA40KT02_9HYME|nr:hypothetical protein K0M31_017945 [Melipona bicolor]
MGRRGKREGDGGLAEDGGLWNASISSISLRRRSTIETVGFAQPRGGSDVDESMGKQTTDLAGFLWRVGGRPVEPHGSTISALPG